MSDKSDAVKSIEAEKAAESRTFKNDELDEDLEETFSASDPVSVSTLTETAGSPDTDRGVN
jgi:hypothetical protein